MDPRQFTRQFEAQAATVAATPPLADNYVLSDQVTGDGFVIGAPDLLDMSPNGQLRIDALGFQPVSGLNLISRFRV